VPLLHGLFARHLIRWTDTHLALAADFTCMHSTFAIPVYLADYHEGLVRWLGSAIVVCAHFARNAYRFPSTSRRVV
jgi:hypothetical protein